MIICYQLTPKITNKIYYKNITSISNLIGNGRFTLKEKNPEKGIQLYYFYGNNEVVSKFKKILSEYPTFNKSRIMINNIFMYSGLAFLIIIGIVIIISVASPEPSSKWDELSDEEKDWYEENYGDGQFNDIEDAIDNYN